MSDPQVMHDDPDLRERANAIIIHEEALEFAGEDGMGTVDCRPGPTPGSWYFQARRKAGLSEALAAEFDSWARQRAFMLFSTGDPERDGWYPLEERPGWWYLIAYVTHYPDMSFLDD